MRETELYWLAGLLEGEGYFGCSDNIPKLALQMSDKDIVEKAHCLMGLSVKISHIPGKRAEWSDTYMWKLRGKAAFEWMNTLYPMLGARRRKQIEEARLTYDPKNQRHLNKNIDAAFIAKIEEKIDAGMTIRKACNEMGIHHTTYLYHRDKRGTHPSHSFRE